MSKPDTQNISYRQEYDQKDSFPFSAMFPDSYFAEQEERENKKLEDQKKRSAKQARLGVLADTLRLIGDGIGLSKGAHTEKHQPDKNIGIAYSELERYKGDHARALDRIQAGKIRTKMWDAGQARDQFNRDRSYEFGQQQADRAQENVDRNFEQSKTNADRNHALREKELNWRMSRAVSPEQQHEWNLETIRARGEESRKTVGSRKGNSPLIYIDPVSNQARQVDLRVMDEMVRSYLTPYQEALAFTSNMTPPEGMDKKEWTQKYMDAKSLIKQYESDPSFESIKKYTLTGTADEKDESVLTNILNKVWDEDTYNRVNQALFSKGQSSLQPLFADNPQPANSKGEITRNPIDDMQEAPEQGVQLTEQAITTRLKELPEYRKAKPEEAAERVALSIQKELMNSLGPTMRKQNIAEEIWSYYTVMGVDQDLVKHTGGQKQAKDYVNNLAEALWAKKITIDKIL